MEYDQLQGCCGVRVFYEFDYTDCERHPSDPNDAENDETCTCLENIKTTLKNAIPTNPRSGPGLLMATTIPQQEFAIQALESLGFQKLIVNFSNPNSDGGLVTLWGLLVNQPTE